jgi:arylsulfatase
MHPELAVAPAQTEWLLSGDLTRLPEFTAPKLGNRANVLTMDLDLPSEPEGVLYKLGANSGGLTLFIDSGALVYEYNLFIVHRSQIRSTTPLPTGRIRLTVTTTPLEPRRATPLRITIDIDGTVVADGTVPISAPLTFTANDGLDIGKALGSPVSLDYHDRAPFEFNGHIEQVQVRYLEAN